ncbi:Dopamine receptor 2 [Orchesella cincta]|uniref:Dopamine receptor 2 n=1 Tax=Orchesella cincta TaxID=48709 RepID=A0A1D2N421_ORCCI|nr:Dopamine receptor 2 [Orchesella cincta]
MTDFPASISDLIHSHPNGNATLDYHNLSTLAPPEMSGTETTIASGVYSSPATVFGVLVTFSLCTVFGNTLVMLAVKREHYLQSPPNYFVASLAAADFFVGVLLIPFEAITQLFNRQWIFGDIWCDLWHSFDVLFATASILNLCVISLDRYWAICTPFSYSRRMTSKRAYRFIALVWICAIVISLPAIFWWRSVREEPVPPGTCPFTDDVSYLISSSCISFYIPLSVMLFAYYKIYLAAVKQSRSIQQGAKLFAHENGTEITLRMHRGGSNGQNGVLTNTAGGKSPSAIPPTKKNIFFGRSDPSGLSMMNCATGASSGVSSQLVKAVNYKTSSKFVRNTGKRTFSEPSVQPERKLSPSMSPEAIPSMSDDENPEMLESKVTAAVHLILQPPSHVQTATPRGGHWKQFCLLMMPMQPAVLQ